MKYFFYYKKKTLYLYSKVKKRKAAALQPVVTPKARLAEALGIRPMKNPWQLGLPSMTGSIGQSSNSLTNQRWRAGVPSLSLLGSNSELDYLSELVILYLILYSITIFFTKFLLYNDYIFHYLRLVFEVHFFIA